MYQSGDCAAFGGRSGEECVRVWGGGGECYGWGLVGGGDAGGGGVEDEAAGAEIVGAFALSIHGFSYFGLRDLDTSNNHRA